eukprot:gene4014-2868_t
MALPVGLSAIAVHQLHVHQWSILRICILAYFSPIVSSMSDSSTPWHIVRPGVPSGEYPIEFDSTANRHVEGNIRGFYYAVPRSSSVNEGSRQNPANRSSANRRPVLVAVCDTHTLLYTLVMDPVGKANERDMNLY